jgi:DNA-binding response OmpR family regulator
MPKKILVVDDDPDIVKLLEMRLRENGYQVATALNGVACLAKVKEYKPDLIILDMMLPDIQGSSLCAKLKSDPQSEFIPIIFLTGRKGEYDRDVGRAAKSDAYLTKPFEPAALLRRIKELTGEEPHR